MSEGKGKGGIFIRFGWAGSEHRYFNAGASMAWSKIHNTIGLVGQDSAYNNKNLLILSLSLLDALAIMSSKS